MTVKLKAPDSIIKPIIARTLEKFKDSNLYSAAAREYIASEIIRELRQN